MGNVQGNTAQIVAAVNCDSPDYARGLVEGLTRNMASQPEVSAQLNRLRDMLLMVIDERRECKEILCRLNEAIEAIGVIGGVYYFGAKQNGRIEELPLATEVSREDALMISKALQYWEEITDDVIEDTLHGNDRAYFAMGDDPVSVSARVLVGAVLSAVARRANKHTDEDVE